MTRRFAVVAGARPNFMKVAPLLPALRARGATPLLVHTGQHYDAAMSGSFFEVLGLPEADVNFGVGSSTHAIQTGAVMTHFEAWLPGAAVDAVIVVGDVNSTMACALVAAKAGIPVAHVEAGLRSFDRSMPEEVNRIVTDGLATWLFATSPDAVANLTAEGIEPCRIHLVGNVMADSLFASIGAARKRAPWKTLGLEGRFGLITLHRPALVDDPALLSSVLEALNELATEVPFVFPVHPRTQATLRGSSLSIGNLRLVDPLDYLDFVALEERAAVVVTDSGGVQEETSLLGTWCVTIRPSTERPITVTAGTNTVVGYDTARLGEAVARALGRTECAPARIALWDGHASDRIADILVARIPEPSYIPPTLKEEEGNELDAMFA
jgi:UDP-N-acetylglucosamine 2-epimerase (non-hydrolysing)